jgi:hypothetical protein
VTGHPLTPDDLLPDVGGQYRHRVSGKVETLWYSVAGRTVHIGEIWMHWDQFWRDYIHAESRR